MALNTGHISQQVPVEIVDQILAHVDDESDTPAWGPRTSLNLPDDRANTLRACRLVSRSFKVLVEPYLFRNIYMTTNDRDVLNKLLEELKSNPHRAKAVKRVYLCVYGHLRSYSADVGYITDSILGLLEELWTFSHVSLPSATWYNSPPNPSHMTYMGCLNPSTLTTLFLRGIIFPISVLTSLHSLLHLEFESSVVVSDTPGFSYSDMSTGEVKQMQPRKIICHRSTGVFPCIVSHCRADYSVLEELSLITDRVAETFSLFPVLSPFWIPVERLRLDLQFEDVLQERHQVELEGMLQGIMVSKTLKSVHMTDGYRGIMDSSNTKFSIIKEWLRITGTNENIERLEFTVRVPNDGDHATLAVALADNIGSVMEGMKSKFPALQCIKVNAQLELKPTDLESMDDLKLIWEKVNYALRVSLPMSVEVHKGSLLVSTKD